MATTVKGVYALKIAGVERCDDASAIVASDLGRVL